MNNLDEDIYNSSSVDLLVVVEAGEVAEELLLGDEKGEVEGGQQFELQEVDFLGRNASDFGVEVVFVVEVVVELGRDHETGDQESNSAHCYLWML